MMLPHWSDPPICSMHCSLVQLDVIVCLQQHVAELRVGDPLAFQPAPDGVPVQHHVDGEVLSDVAQELDRRIARVHARLFSTIAPRWAVEVDEPLELSADPPAHSGTVSSC